jgi:uncharacterized YigZ family protein
LLRIPVTDKETKIVIKKSIFISNAIPLKNVSEVKATIQHVRTAHPGAHHVVWAYIIGDRDARTMGMSDDGEPNGTAGKPVLTVLDRQHYTDILVTVTRYFGGIKLGKGGLVRAYTESVVQLLEGMSASPKRKEICLQLQADYAYYDRIKRVLCSYNAKISEESFLDSVIVTCSVAEDFYEIFREKIYDITNGNICMSSCS